MKCYPRTHLVFIVCLLFPWLIESWCHGMAISLRQQYQLRFLNREILIIIKRLVNIICWQICVTCEWMYFPNEYWVKLMFYNHIPKSTYSKLTWKTWRCFASKQERSHISNAPNCFMKMNSPPRNLSDSFCLDIRFIFSTFKVWKFGYWHQCEVFYPHNICLHTILDIVKIGILPRDGYSYIHVPMYISIKIHLYRVFLTTASHNTKRTFAHFFISFSTRNHNHNITKYHFYKTDIEAYVHTNL